MSPITYLPKYKEWDRLPDVENDIFIVNNIYSNSASPSPEIVYLAKYKEWDDLPESD
jgi:hypothetical protein